MLCGNWILVTHQGFIFPKGCTESIHMSSLYIFRNNPFPLPSFTMKKKLVILQVMVGLEYGSYWEGINSSRMWRTLAIRDQLSLIALGRIF